MYFGSKTIRLHLLRGFLGFLALYLLVSLLDRTIWLSLLLIPIVLYLLKGCPMCWTIGLVETIVTSVRRDRKGAEPADPKVSDIALSRILLGDVVCPIPAKSKADHRARQTGNS